MSLVRLHSCVEPPQVQFAEDTPAVPSCSSARTALQPIHRHNLNLSARRRRKLDGLFFTTLFLDPPKRTVNEHASHVPKPWAEGGKRLKTSDPAALQEPCSFNPRSLTKLRRDPEAYEKKRSKASCLRLFTMNMALQGRRASTISHYTQNEDRW